jgi:Rrf2 family protein
MHITARVDYALRAMVELASGDPNLVKGERIATAQAIPLKLLENILLDLKHGGLVRSQRGFEGGYGLAKPAEDITLADVIRVVEGPLANVRGVRPEAVGYKGLSEPLRDVWIAVRASLRTVLESVTIADIVGGTLPASIKRMLAKPEAWLPH